MKFQLIFLESDSLMERKSLIPYTQSQILNAQRANTFYESGYASREADVIVGEVKEPGVIYRSG